MTDDDFDDADDHKIPYYHKNSTEIWLEVIITLLMMTMILITIIIICIDHQVEVIPIRNEAELVVLFLCNYRDITAFKVRQATLYLIRYLDLVQLYFSSTPIIFPPPLQLQGHQGPAYLMHIMKISLASMLVSKTPGSNPRRLQKLWQPCRW